ncbi:FkbM family methyltransferase [Dinghuibacter silviterrae]|uniref:FkbM family methyltransferase n=1 Tax=Dinghuibacter silviterrae TaxID=1539049 RepID=A0A4V3GM26_9BACT|nr:FkbM family methyltransferase [Dinghuibacter silviterrae]TDX01733.1 FkbM family methyltransferase [Dinghuibacter silviterrae]
MLQPQIRKLKRTLAVFAGQITPIKTEVSIPHEWYGNAYGGFFVHPDLLNDRSVVYSFGIGEDVSFDLTMIEKHGCNVYGFDPTPKSIEWVKRQTLPPQFIFNPYGINAETGFVQFNLPRNKEYVSGSIEKHKGVDESEPILVPMKSFTDITRELGHQHVDLVKIDIEGTEYEIIDHILSSPVSIGQILIELHERFFRDGTAKTGKLLETLKRHSYAVFGVSETFEEVSFIKI